MKETINGKEVQKRSIDSIKMNKSMTDNAIDTTKKVQLITITAIFAALITVTTAYIFHIPVALTGGYIHVGDGLIYLASTILPAPYAIIAAVIGGGMADLLTAPMWVLPTVVIKALITLPFTNKSMKIVTVRNVFASIIAFIISGMGYYIANTIIFGYEIAFLTSIFSSAMQSAGSALLFVIIGMALDNMKFKARFL